MFALGDSSYPSFCGFGKLLDAQLNNLGASRMLDIGLGDELGDRDATFKEWSELAFQQAALKCNLDISNEQTRGEKHTEKVLKLVPSSSSELEVEFVSERRKHSASNYLLYHLITVLEPKLREEHKRYSFFISK